MFLGNWELEDLLTFTVATHNTSGVATDADSVPAYRVYEDETTTPILTGSMALLDAANTAGLYSEQITLSAANGLEVGKSYTIQIAATVGGTAGVTLRQFKVELAPATLAGQATIAGYLDTEVAAIKAKTDLIPVDPATETNVNANETKLDTIAGYLDTEVAAIKAKTDLIPASPATLGNQTTIMGYLDTEIAAIKSTTDALSPLISGGAFTTPALANAPGGGSGGSTVEEIVDGVEASTVILAIKASTDLIPRILGLSQDNSVLDDTTYDDDGNLTAGTIYLYDTKAHATTHDGTTGLLYSYSVSATLVSGNVTEFKQLRES